MCCDWPLVTNLFVCNNKILHLCCRAHYSKGQVHALCQQWQQAAENYAAATALALPNKTQDPTSYGQSLYCLGVAQQRLGRFEEAVAALKEAQEFWPQPYTLALSLGNALAAVGRREEAVGVVEGALRVGPGVAEGQAVAVKEALEDLLRNLSKATVTATEEMEAW